MPDSNYYEILEVNHKATQGEIKQAYRRLAKRFHPDSKSEAANHERIVVLNTAYEILSDPQRRRTYDRQLVSGHSDQSSVRRHQRNADAQNRYRCYRQTEQEADAQLERWFKEVYVPVNRLVCCILNPLDIQLDYLSADPFDDQLMEAFQGYLEECRNYLYQAHQTFVSQPNPAKVAGAAAHLYYCLNQIGDGIEELERFTLNYDEYFCVWAKNFLELPLAYAAKPKTLPKQLRS